MSEAYYDIAIIGAGASGLAAAISAAGAHPGASLAVLERNTAAGRKINATGNGRCNFLNSNAEAKSYFSNSEKAAADALLSSVFKAHPVEDLISFFASIGMIPVYEENGRLYPRSFQARSVSSALIRAAEAAGADIVTSFSAAVCSRAGKGFVIRSDGSRAVVCDKLIIASGGKAGMQYGCFGDGYRFAEAFGHKVIKPIPALTQLTVSGDISQLFGVRAKGCISLFELAAGDKPEAKLLASDSGEIQFTKNTLSGICTFNVSRFLRRAPGRRYAAFIDLFEEYTEDELMSLFRARMDAFGDLPSVLFGLLPDKLCDWLLSDFDGTPEELAGLCKGLKFEIEGTRSWNDSQVSSGGVDLSGICPETLGSRLVPGLSFCGEVLDVDAVCGGYNLSFAFASGLLAGERV